ncbi:MAG TPA: sigma-54 dependent transcriptional regulator [Chitinivibrionales bacterium]|nr:sigma-54 dependent transcriptional regulator [Chitinivibrionales bacterium]
MKPETIITLPVLLVDDELDFLKSASVTLRLGGFAVATCQNSGDVLTLMAGQRFGVVLLDIMMPENQGTQLLPEIVKAYPESPVIMLTAINNVDTAVCCMRAGAFDYLVKPVEKDRLITSVRRAMDFVEIRNENTRLKGYLLDDRLQRPELFERFVTRDRKMTAIFQYVEAIAQTPMPVLITGETGAGKELIARIIHDASGRSGEFVSVNTAGLDDSMVSDTLFGHEKGAFTGADSRREGLVAKASGGTLFLDEIGDLPRESQVKLLRLLDDRTYYPVGSDSLRQSTARIIVATNRDMVALRKEGTFRSDLYFRLQSHQIDLPPLRERPSDIPLLIDHFVERASVELKHPAPSVPQGIYALLAAYPFPGNVRELRNLIFDSVSVEKGGTLAGSFFTERLSKVTGSVKGSGVSTLFYSPEDLSRLRTLPAIKDAESMLINEALRRAGNNQTIAAQLLGMTRSALNKRLTRGKQ